jgi:hypothetical protein
MLRLLGRRKREEERRDELLSAYLDGELGERECQRLEARLAQDATLRAELSALRQTVSLMQELPQVAAPRNFILSESMVRRRQPAAGPEPRARSRRAQSRAWAAPLLTAATAVVSLLFAVVLVGDLLLPGIGGLATAPQPMEQAKEIPQIALEAAPAEEEVRVEREVEPSPTSAPLAAAEAPPEEPETAAVEKEHAEVEGEVAHSPAPPTQAVEAPAEEPAEPVEGEEKAAEQLRAEEAVPETETPSAAVGAGGPTEEAAAIAAPTVVSGEAWTPTIAPEAPELYDEVAEGEPGLLEPSPDDAEVAPSPSQAEDRGLAAPVRGRLPWEVLEVGLGLTAVVLAFMTVRAWRARRR